VEEVVGVEFHKFERWGTDDGYVPRIRNRRYIQSEDREGEEESDEDEAECVYADSLEAID
jgi:hypothetical protein